ncbi:MAG: HAD family hydrolase [Methanosphaera sp.]|nr:HAD family hydrolase [Methanosphaera sp.]
MKRLFIFDLDGMILDTIEDSFECVNQALEEFDIPPYKVDLKSMHYPTFRKYLNDNNAGKETPVYPRYIELFRNHPLNRTAIFEGVPEVLRNLQDRGVTLAICSNRDEKVVRVLAKRFFNDIDFKYISGFREGVPDKPNPFRINDIINAEGVDRCDVIYFGDKDADIQVARNAEIDLVLVTYGQGSPEDYESDYPLAVIDKATEILDLINDGIIKL